MRSSPIILSLLFRCCAQDQWTALMLAAENGHKDVVEFLVKAGADVDHQEKVGGPNQSLAGDMFTLVSNDVTLVPKKLLATVATHASTHASVDSSDLWCWDSNHLVQMSVAFETKVNTISLPVLLPSCLVASSLSSLAAPLQYIHTSPQINTM